MKQSELKEELLLKLGIRPLVILSRIEQYILRQKIIQEEYRNSGSRYDVKALDYNYVPLDIEWVKETGVTQTYTSNKEKNRAARKYLKQLEDEDVIFPLQAGGYIINPLIFYIGRRYLEAYQEWIDLTNSRPVQEFIKHSEKEWNPITKRWDWVI